MEVIQSNMKLKTVMLDPETAAMFLEKNHPRQRNKKDSKISQYASDILNGLWQLNHQAVAFDEDGYLIDGQNRCEAIIAAEKPAPVALITGVPRQGIMGTDCGVNRRFADMAKIKGEKYPYSATAFSSIARRMAIGLEKHKRCFSIQDTMNFIKGHMQALTFAIEISGGSGGKRGITQAPVRAVLGRAWYKRNSRERIRTFGGILLNGLMDNVKTDTSAIRLREWLLEHLTPGKRSHGKRPGAVEVYAKTETALQAFLDGVDLPMDRLYATSKELFPIATDDEPQEEAA